MCKRLVFFLLITVVLLTRGISGHAQANELAQLALNIEKLAQFKSILQNMYDGYKVLATGYNKVKDVANGNYKLHQVFLDGLYAVSPEVRKYRRIPDIITCQLNMAQQYKAALTAFRGADVFSPEYISYLESVYKNLIDRSLSNLEELTLIITANQLRMNDKERLDAIDRIYADMTSKQVFLQEFNEETQLYYFQRKKQQAEISGMRALYGE